MPYVRVCSHFYNIYVYTYICIYICLFSILPPIPSPPPCEIISLNIYVNACTVVWTIGGNSWTEWRSMTFFSIFFFRCSPEVVSCPSTQSISPPFFFVLRFDRATPGLFHRVKKVSFCTLVYSCRSVRGGRAIHDRREFVLIHGIFLGGNSSAGSNFFTSQADYWYRYNFDERER